MTGPGPIYSGASPQQVAADLAPLLDFQVDGLSPEALRQLIAERLLPHLLRYDHPGFQSMFNAVPSAEAKLGAQLALETNQGVTNWQVSPGGAMLEELCGRALCHLFGLAPTADATFMYSGTYANQQALYLALHRHAERRGFDLAQAGLAGFGEPRQLAVLVSADAHFSLRHAARMLGLGEAALVSLPVDANRRIDALRARHLITDLQAERELVAVVATAGTTNTGAIDPIEALADLCDYTGAWLHVDGAYGYAYKLVPARRHHFAGDTRADSITWDPHKQLGAPIPNSLLFLKNADDFGRMALHSSYFNRADDPRPNPGLKSPPSTRPLSALPLVAILRGQGLRQVVANLRAPLAAIKELAEVLQRLPGVRLCHQPDTGILCFQITPPGLPESQIDALQRRLYDEMSDGGERSISITTLNERTALRLVAIAPHASVHHLRQTVTALQKMATAIRASKSDF